MKVHVLCKMGGYPFTKEILKVSLYRAILELLKQDYEVNSNEGSFYYRIEEFRLETTYD